MVVARPRPTTPTIPTIPDFPPATKPGCHGRPPITPPIIGEPPVTYPPIGKPPVGYPPIGFPPNPYQNDPFAELRELIRQLMLRLQGPGNVQQRDHSLQMPTLQNAVKPSAYPGLHVGGLSFGSGPNAPGAYQSVRVDEVLGATSSRKEAMNAARIVSQRIGMPVAIIEHRTSQYPPNYYDIPMPVAGAANAAATPAAQAMYRRNPPFLPDAVTYEIVVLDPAIDPAQASNLTAYSQDGLRVSDLVFGYRSARTSPQVSYPSLPPVGPDKPPYGPYPMPSPPRPRPIPQPYPYFPDDRLGGGIDPVEPLEQPEPQFAATPLN